MNYCPLGFSGQHPCLLVITADWKGALDAKVPIECTMNAGGNSRGNVIHFPPDIPQVSNDFILIEAIKTKLAEDVCCKDCGGKLR